MVKCTIDFLSFWYIQCRIEHSESEGTILNTLRETEVVHEERQTAKEVSEVSESTL